MGDGYADQTIAHKQLLHVLNEISQFGKTADGGIARLAASREDGQARDYLCKWLEKNDFEVLVDPVGNIFGVLDLEQGDPEEYFFCGSHLDSQPHGGRFDGTLGVVAACIAGLCLKAQITSGSIKSHYRYFVAVTWTGEEGARYQPSLLGSSTFAGLLNQADVLQLEDANGIRLGAALTQIGYQGTAQIPKPSHYLEFHIEQGPELEAAGLPVGIVTGSWGAKKFLVECLGEQAHTGPTPMEKRRDGLLAAAQTIAQVGELPRKASAVLYSSVGRIEVSPNSPNTVADVVRLWIEVRSSDANALGHAEDTLKGDIDTIGQSTGCQMRIVSSESRKVVEFDPDSISTIESAFDQADIPFQRMTTIAGHDALRLQSICPSTLLFIPSENGISHSPEEFTSDEDICAGFDAMMKAIISIVTTKKKKLATERNNKWLH